MSETTLDQQFAALPVRVKVSLFRVLDILAAHEAGDWQVAGDTLDRMQELEDQLMPAPAKAVLRGARGVVTALSLEYHERRVQWARDEGFPEGIEVLLAAMRGGPYDRKRVESDD